MVFGNKSISSYHKRYKPLEQSLNDSLTGFREWSVFLVLSKPFNRQFISVLIVVKICISNSIVNLIRWFQENFRTICSPRESSVTLTLC